MPQVRGAAKWLTNVRQECPVPRVWIDQSEEHIINSGVEEDMKRKIDNLSLQQHRCLADAEYELTEAKKLVSEYSQMQQLVKQNSVATIMKRRPSVMPPHASGNESKSPGNPSFLLITNGGKTGEHSPRAKTAKHAEDKVFKHGFSRVSVDEDSDNDDAIVFTTKMPTLTAVRSEPVRVKPASPPKSGRPRIRRARTAYLPGRSVREIRAAVHAEFTQPKDKKSRPKTAVGIQRDGSADEDSENEDVAHDAALGGRSFQELKKMSHIDKLVNAEKEAKKKEHLKKLSQRRKSEAAALQEKLNKFYKNVDDFKKESSKTVFNSFL